MEYYRAGVEQRRPKYVPSTVRLTARVTGDFPIGQNTVAEAGEHPCQSNIWGAISVVATNGKRLGIKPAEFEPVTWRTNDEA